MVSSGYKVCLVEVKRIHNPRLVAGEKGSVVDGAPLPRQPRRSRIIACRSRVDISPRIPAGSRLAIASSKHCLLTGHSEHTFFAHLVDCPRLGKNLGSKVSQHEPSYLHHPGSSSVMY